MSFFRVLSFTEKTSPVTITAVLINPLGNFPHTHTHGFIEIIIMIKLRLHYKSAALKERL